MILTVTTKSDTFLLRQAHHKTDVNMMTHRGPFQPLLFCDSVILWSVEKTQQQALLKFASSQHLWGLKYYFQ